MKPNSPFGVSPHSVFIATPPVRLPQLIELSERSRSAVKSTKARARAEVAGIRDHRDRALSDAELRSPTSRAGSGQVPPPLQLPLPRLLAFERTGHRRTERPWGDEGV